MEGEDKELQKGKKCIKICRERGKSKMRKDRCVECGKYLVMYTKGKNMCQVCYRGYLERYSYWGYGRRKPRSKRAEKILEKIIEENISARKYVERYGEKEGVHSVAYVNNLMYKYLVRCDTYGKVRPDLEGRVRNGTRGNV